MSLGLSFREQLSGALQIVQEELDQLIAGIQGTLGVEHKETGAHGDITADSITLATDATYGGTLLGDLQLAGQTRFLRGPWWLDPPGNDIHIAMLRPSQITANQNNYDPGGIDNAIGLEIESDAARTITGIARRHRQKRLLLIGNRGNFAITLAHNSGSSTAGNRFSFPSGAAYLLSSAQYVWLYYDVGSEVWRPIGVAAPVSARANQPSNQTIVTATNTKVQLSTEDWDTHSAFDSATNYRFTAPVTGKYWVSGAVEMNVSAAEVTAMIFKNGAVYARAIASARSGGSATGVVTSLVDLAATDYVELYVTHNQGSDRSVIGGSDDTYLSVSLVP